MIFDLAVIGGGAAGLVAAKFAKGLGKKVILIEKNRTGGECTWSGCIPSKKLLAEAKLARCNGSITDDNAERIAVMQRVRETVEQFYREETPVILRSEDIDTVEGEATFVSENELTVNGNRIRFHKAVIAAGSRPFIPPVRGLDDIPYLTNVTLFDLPRVPLSLAIIGSGAMAVEMAYAFSLMGTKVYLFVKERILPRVEENVSREIREMLQDAGAELFDAGQIDLIRREGGETILTGVWGELRSEHLLVATGRYFSPARMGLPEAKVTCTEKGIITDRYMMTSNKRIAAAGDCTSQHRFTHVAEYQAILAVRNLFFPAPLRKKRDDSFHPMVVYTDPECAAAGLTLSEAIRRYGSSVREYTVKMEQTDRSRLDGCSGGQLTCITTAHGRIVGVHIAGCRAGELLTVFQTAKHGGLRLEQLADMVFPYPGYTDAIKKVARKRRLDAIYSHPLVRLARLFGLGAK